MFRRPGAIWRGIQRGLQCSYRRTISLQFHKTRSDQKKRLGADIGILDLRGDGLQEGDDIGILLLQFQRRSLPYAPTIGVGVPWILLQEFGIELLGLVILSQQQAAFCGDETDIRE